VTDLWQSYCILQSHDQSAHCFSELPQTQASRMWKRELSASQEREDCAGLQFIPDFHRSYDPLQYPLIFPDVYLLYILEYYDGNRRNGSMEQAKVEVKER